MEDKHNWIGNTTTYFYSIPLKIKLLTLVMGAIIGMVLVGYVGIVSMDTMSVEDIRMYEETTVITTKLSTLTAYTGAYARSVSELITETDPTEISRLERKIKISDSAILDISEELISISRPELAPAIERFSSAHDNYKNSIRKAFELKSLGYNTEAATLYHMEAGPLYYATENALLNLIDLQNELSFQTVQLNQEIVNRAQNDIIIVVSITTLILALLAWLTINSILLPINKCTLMLQELTKGHISTRLHLAHTDEIGQMGSALDAYAEYLQTTIVRTLHALSRGEKNLELVPVSDTQDEISPALNVMIQTILDLMDQVSALIEDAKHGNLETRGDPDAFVGQYRDIVLGINTMLDFITTPLGEASRVLTKYAEIDFSARFSDDIRTQGTLKDFKDKINIVGEHIENVLGQAIGGVKDQMENLVASSNTLQENLQTVETTGNVTQNSIYKVQENAKEAQESIDQVSSEIDNINEILGNISAKLNITSDLSIEMDNAAKIGSGKTKATEESLELMQSSVEEVYEHMTEIFKEMQHISVIAKNIRSIADSTNILSLNAGLEAGRAGEYGESFGIIADEVKQLAEQSFDSAQEIANIIQKLKQKSVKAEYCMGQAIMSVETGATTITETVTTFKEIAKQIIQITEQISDLNTLTIQEAEYFKSITAHITSLVEKNVDTLNQSVEAKNMSSKTTIAIEELRETIENLTHITTKTQDAINQLK